MPANQCVLQAKAPRKARVLGGLHVWEGLGNVLTSNLLGVCHCDLTVGRVIKQDQEVVIFELGDIIGVPTSDNYPTTAQVPAIQGTLVREVPVRNRGKVVINKVTVAIGGTGVAAQDLELVVEVEVIHGKGSRETRLTSLVNSRVNFSDIRTTDGLN